MNKPLSNLVDLSTIFVFYSLWWLSVVITGKVPATIGAPFVAVKYFGFPGPFWLWGPFLGAGAIAFWVPVFNPFREKSDEYGGAHWASRREIKELGLLAEDGLIMGQTKGRYFKKYLRTDQPLSMLLYAPPQSLKTAGIIIPSLLSCDNSAIVHDPKGELYIKTGPQRSEFSKVIKFAPGEAESARWNPFSKKDLPTEWEDVQVTVDRMATSLISAEKNKSQGEDMWTREARSIFIFWALYLIHRDGETSMPAILRAALSSGEPQEAIEEAMDAMTGLPERIVLEGNGLLAKAHREFAGVLGTFKSFMNVFLDGRVAKNLSGSNFSLPDLRKETTTIYLAVKNTDQTRLKPLLSLFFEAATLTALDHEPAPEEKSITIFLDEFVRLARMQELLEMPAIGRSYRLNAIYVCQSVSQIVDIYGQAGADQLKNTCSYHVYYSQNEPKVAQDISNSIGNCTRKKRSLSYQAGRLMSGSSVADEGVPLIRPQEIQSLKKGRILICSQNAFETPVDAQSSAWFLDPALYNLVPEMLRVDPLPANAKEIAESVILKNQPLAHLLKTSGDPQEEVRIAEQIEPITEVDCTDVQEQKNPLGKAEASDYLREKVEIAEQIKPIAKADKQNGGADKINPETSDDSQVENQIAQQIESGAKEDHPQGAGVDQKAVGRCSQCGRSTYYQNRIGETCMDILLDGSMCSGKFGSLDSSNINQQAA